jgi:hypothetical protein
LLESTVKVSAPIWMVATPSFSAFTSPIMAPVLSFTDMPVVSVALAPTLAAASCPAAVGGALEDDDDGGGAEPGACANAGAARAKVAAKAAYDRLLRIYCSRCGTPHGQANKPRSANVPDDGAFALAGRRSSTEVVSGRLRL